MDFQDVIQEIFLIDTSLQQKLLDIGIQVGIFIALIVGAWLLSQLILLLLRLGLNRFAPHPYVDGYNQVIMPIRRSLLNTLFSGLTTLTLYQIEAYEGLYNTLHFFIYLAFSICAGFFISHFVHQILHVYGVKMVQKVSRDVNDLLTVIENLANAIIVFFVIVYFAQTQDLNLISVLAGLGIVGLALSFAAKETLAQVIGSIVLYLDRPYLPGEYIRVNFNIKDDDVYGRVEAIGLRSTKIRVAAKNTLVVVPNSVMVTKDIENISRGTKVMSLLYLDFPKNLNPTEQALVQDIVSDAIGNLLGVEPLSAKVFLFKPEDKAGTRARVSFFLLSSNQSSLGIRKRLVDVTNQKIAARFAKYDLEFTLQDPMLYIDSPVTR